MMHLGNAVLPQRFPAVASSPWRLVAPASRAHAWTVDSALSSSSSSACGRVQHGFFGLHGTTDARCSLHRTLASSKGTEETSGAEDRGWWESAEERSLQVNSVEPLELWQEERLQKAFALEGRRKLKVQGLADELDLDRGRVLAWVKEFAGMPASEREPIMAKFRQQAEKQRGKEPQQPQQQQAAAPSSECQPEVKGEGFIPFYTRKEMGLVGRKRLPAEVTRTLESIYRRTPFPSDDLIRGVWELHKLKRDVALDWFKQRREVDGITSSTQKRRERPRGGSASVFIEEGDDDGVGAGPRGGDGSGSQSDNMLMSLMSDVAPKREEEDKVKVVHITRAEMATIRSSMPSRNKARGRKIAEKMGVKMDEEDDNVFQIGNIRYVTESAEEAANRWTQAWRYKRTSQAPAKPVVLRKAQGAGSRGRSGDADEE